MPIIADLSVYIDKQNIIPENTQKCNILTRQTGIPWGFAVPVLGISGGCWGLSAKTGYFRHFLKNADNWCNIAISPVKMLVIGKKLYNLQFFS